MRFRNLTLLLGIVCGAFFAFLLVQAFAQAVGLPGLGGAYGSLTQLIVREIAPRILMAYAVLFVGGMLLFHILDSPVPLKWCLALGSIYGLAYFGLMLVTVGGDFLAGLFCLGMLISPVLGCL